MSAAKDLMRQVRRLAGKCVLCGVSEPQHGEHCDPCRWWLRRKGAYFMRCSGCQVHAEAEPGTWLPSGWEVEESGNGAFNDVFCEKCRQ